MNKPSEKKIYEKIKVNVSIFYSVESAFFVNQFIIKPMTRLIIQKLIFDVEAGHPYVLDWDHNHFRIWRQQLRKEILEELLFDFKLKNTHTLTSASLSADGNYIAVSDQIKARIWCVQYNEVKELELPIVKGCQTVPFHNVTPCSSQSQLEINFLSDTIRIIFAL